MTGHPTSTRTKTAVTRLLPLSGLLLLAFAVRTFGLSEQSLWYDEGYSIMLAQQDAGRIIAQTASLDFNTPLHYLMLHVWTRLAGMSEFSARLLSVFAGVITVALAVPLIHLSVRGRRRHAASLWAVGLLALSPMLVSVAQEARMYALLACWCTLAVVQLLHAQRTGRRRSWLLWAVWNAAAFLTHVIGAVFFAAQALVIVTCWLAQIRRIRQVPSRKHGLLMPWPALGLAGGGMTLFVLYILSFGRAYGVTYAAHLELGTVLLQSFASTMLPHLQPRSLIDLAAGLAAGMVVVAWLAIWRSRSHGLVPLMATLVVGIMAISAFCAWTGKFGQRYPAAVAPLLLAGAGATLAVWPRLPALATGTLLGALSIGGLIAWRSDPIYFFEDFRGAAAHIRQAVTNDETVLLVAGHYWPVFEYYYGNAGWHALPNDAVLDVTNALDYANTIPALNQALTGKGGVWLLLWQDDVIDPTNLTQALLARQSIALSPQLDTMEFHGLRLKHYRFFHPYKPLLETPPVMNSIIEPTDHQRGLSALGCAQFAKPHAGDGFLEVACFWRAAPDSALPTSTQVSLRLMNERGEQVLQSDQRIVANGLPYIPYLKPMTAFYTIPLPADFPAGSYTLRAIPYTDVEQVSPRVVTPIQVLP